jgi:prepilin-type N-terminal cleavage/methylation domain-containing protein
MHTEIGRRDNGTTLVELMVTLAIMSIAIAIISSTLSLAQQATNRMEKSSTAIDSARLLSATLDRELRSAVCIKQPLPNPLPPGNVLNFQTVASPGAGITYAVVDGPWPPPPESPDVPLGKSAVIRTEDGSTRIVVNNVGSTTTAFEQKKTPLRTVVVDIPIRSDNGGVFRMFTTIAGRNAWGQC